MDRKVNVTVNGSQLIIKLLAKTQILIDKIRNAFAATFNLQTYLRAAKDRRYLNYMLTIRFSRENDYGVREDCAVHGDDRPKAPATSNKKTRKNKPPKK